MTISFNDVPSSLRVPFVTAEFDSSQAAQGPALLAYRGLLIGQKTSSGAGTANTLVRATSADDLIAIAGRGSMLHRMAIAWFASNQFTELWVGILADNGSGVAAHGTITVTGPATADGTIVLYPGGERVEVAVTNGDADTVIAAAINAAINADLDLPVTSTVSSAVATVTFRHKGTVGNDYSLRHSLRDGEALPAGVGVAIVALASGATNPVLTTLIAAMGDTWFNIIAHPYTDATSLTALEAELASRFGPMRMIDGLAITAGAGSFSTLATLGEGRNSAHSVILAQPGINTLTPGMEFAAEAAAIVARAGAADPARPFQTLGFVHAQAPAETDLFTIEERNLLLFDGIATTRAATGGVVQLDRVITTYQTNATGADDTAYLDATTLLTLMYLRYDWRQRIATKYPRHKLAADSSRLGSGQAVMTPALGKGEALGWFREKEKQGLVENFDLFKANLVCERNDSDPNRLDWLLPPDLINQLIVAAAQIQFRL
jgi:phage tail sheath gpL-like